MFKYEGIKHLKNEDTAVFRRNNSPQRVFVYKDGSIIVGGKIIKIEDGELLVDYAFSPECNEYEKVERKLPLILCYDKNRNPTEATVKDGTHHIKFPVPKEPSDLLEMGYRDNIYWLIHQLLLEEKEIKTLFSNKKVREFLRNSDT